MTTKPKARKFRIRRSPQPGMVDAHGDNTPVTAPAAANTPDDTLRQGELLSSAELSSEETIEDIRKQGLTGRELRMARRLAQKHGLAPTSDFDAVRLLRARGIDPFQRGSMLELVSAKVGLGGGSGGGGNDDGGAQLLSGHPDSEPGDSGRVQLPQTIQTAKQTLPAPGLSPADRRAAEITSIQRDIARRRRRKMALLFTRLMAFVFLPTLIAGYYFYVIATPMYSTKSEFLIITADGSGGGQGGLGGLLPSQFATGQDSIAVQSYLESKDAMLRLNEDVGFKAMFSSEDIDPLQRLDPEATNEAAYKVYQKYVNLGYDPTEGVIRLEVATADPETSREFSEKLIEYAEERVDALSQEKRFDAVKTAEAALQEAKEERRAAQRQL